MPALTHIREHAIGNCLAILQSLNPYLCNGGAFVAGVGSPPGSMPTVDSASVKKYAGETAIKALMRLDTILDDEKYWDGRDVLKLHNLALKAVAAHARGQIPPAVLPPQPFFSGPQA